MINVMQNKTNTVGIAENNGLKKECCDISGQVIIICAHIWITSWWMDAKEGVSRKANGKGKEPAPLQEKLACSETQNPRHQWTRGQEMRAEEMRGHETLLNSKCFFSRGGKPQDCVCWSGMTCFFSLFYLFEKQKAMERVTEKVGRIKREMHPLSHFPNSPNSQEPKAQSFSAHGPWRAKRPAPSPSAFQHVCISRELEWEVEQDRKSDSLTRFVGISSST